MELQEFLRAMLRSVPEQKIVGKKRLQKLVHLLKRAGAEVDADFRIHHYGPFSYQVAQAAAELILDGHIVERSEPLGVYGTFQTTYTFNKDAPEGTTLDERYANIAGRLNSYSTIELEVASTISFFESAGFQTAVAVERTKQMKPSRAIPPILAKSEEILALVR